MDDADRAQVLGDMWLDHHLRLGRTVGEVGRGVCRDCGEAIPLKRLWAMPSATRCIDCQTVAEGGRL